MVPALLTFGRQAVVPLGRLLRMHHVRLTLWIRLWEQLIQVHGGDNRLDIRLVNVLVRRIPCWPARLLRPSITAGGRVPRRNLRLSGCGSRSGRKHY